MDKAIDICCICKQKVEYSAKGLTLHIRCHKCGKYSITNRIHNIINGKSLSERAKTNASGWLKENQNYTITNFNFNKLLSIGTPTFHDRADKLLLAIEKSTEHAGQYIVKKKSWLSFSWCINEAELDELLEYLQCDPQRIRDKSRNSTNSNRFYKIVHDGWLRLEEIKTTRGEGNQCFVAMWFDESMQKIYDIAISEGIIDAGYFPHKVDQGEHNGKIDDEIIAQIRRSNFILADFTGHRGGVYYEAGFAKGLGLEVIWTCKEDDIDDLHFDIRQYNCITWNADDLNGFRKKIQNRIESVLGNGNYERQQDLVQ